QALQQGQSGGFMRTAMMTAVGVAGGMMLGNALMGALGGGGAAEAATMSADGAAGAFGQEAVPASSPWTDPGQDAAAHGYQDDAGAYDDGGGYDEDI
ncbi:MAG: DUF2076 domain-containing protein, partial [Falsiroseomonas sp.]|nr:DUF2076 domain-containing protein [Falsiroseomonas sp.]